MYKIIPDTDMTTDAGVVPGFLNKLWKMVDDEVTDDLICWSEDGNAFHVLQPNQLASDLLPFYFKHNHLSSFIRQLNMYGFKKLTPVDGGGLKTEREEFTFQHPFFVRFHQHLLPLIKRKVPVKKENAGVLVDAGTQPQVVTELLQEVQQMKIKQAQMNAKMHAIRRQNEDLGQEVSDLRKKHNNQQAIVQRLIQFLVTMARGHRGFGAKRKQQLAIEERGGKMAKYDRQVARPESVNAGMDMFEDFSYDLASGGRDSRITELPPAQNVPTPDAGPSPSPSASASSPGGRAYTVQSPSPAAVPAYSVQSPPSTCTTPEVDPTTLGDETVRYCDRAGPPAEQAGGWPGTRGGDGTDGAESFDLEQWLSEPSLEIDLPEIPIPDVTCDVTLPSPTPLKQSGADPPFGAFVTPSSTSQQTAAATSEVTSSPPDLLKRSMSVEVNDLQDELDALRDLLAKGQFTIDTATLNGLFATDPNQMTQADSSLVRNLADPGSSIAGHEMVRYSEPASIYPDLMTFVEGADDLDQPLPTDHLAADEDIADDDVIQALLRASPKGQAS